MEKKEVLTVLDEKKEAFFAAADAIWETPELRFATYKSVEQHYRILEAEGFTIQKGIADMKNAYVATYGSGKPVIGILGEYDALSNLSQIADLPEEKALVTGASGHGCGHNLLGIGSVAGGVGVKEFLKANQLSGTIKVFGCPAEEGGCGKSYLARAGFFDDLDLALSWHPGDQSSAWGDSSLAVYHVYYHFKGKAAHAAGAPELGRSALDAAELMNLGVQFLREHIIDEARIHYAFKDAGGTSPNVVQASSTLFYYIRAPKIEQAAEIFERVNKIAEGAALMTDTSVTMELDSACYDYIPNQSLTTKMYDNLVDVAPTAYTEEELAYEENYYQTVSPKVKQGIREKLALTFPEKTAAELDELVEKPICTFLLPLTFSKNTGGSTDVGDVSWICPTAQIRIGCEPLGTSAHSWQWVANGKSTVAHNGLLAAGKTIALTAIDALLDPEIIKQAQAEHQTFLDGKTYECAIPATILPDE